MGNFRKAFLKPLRYGLCFTVVALAARTSLAYFAAGISAASASKTATATVGTWDRYTTGTAISTCAALKTAINGTSSSTYYLTNDIDCTGTTLNTTTATFSGKLYGNGYTISNPTIPIARGALFDNISGATIQNLVLDRINIGSSSSRSSNPAAFLAARSQGTGNVISKIRVTNSSLYVQTTTYGTGGILGMSQYGTTTISNVMLSGVTIDGGTVATYLGGIVGQLVDNSLIINDAYFSGTITGKQYAGGILGYITNGSAEVLTLNRAVVYSNTTITTSSTYAGGIVGYNAGAATGQSMTDVFFTGALNASTNRAGILYNGNAISYTNAWAAQWSSSTITAYANMTGVSPSSSTNYIALRSSLTDSWWQTHFSSIISTNHWTYNTTTFLYELKPRV